jgi:predicted kinase
VESFPDFDPLRDDELKQMLDGLVAEERALPTELLRTSYERRVLHGKIDIIGAELVRRRRRREDGDESGRPGGSEPPT